MLFKSSILVALLYSTASFAATVNSAGVEKRDTASNKAEFQGRGYAIAYREAKDAGVEKRDTASNKAEFQGRGYVRAYREAKDAGVAQ